MATLLLGEAAVPARFRGVPNVPAHTGASTAERALFHVVEMCCLSETLAVVVFTEMRKRATNPAATAAMETLLEDEVHHGRAGWAYLASLGSRPRVFDALGAALPDLMSRTVGKTLDSVRAPEPDDPALVRYAYLGHDSVRDLVQVAVHRVILPGFEAAGVDTGAARGYMNTVAAAT